MQAQAEMIRNKCNELFAKAKELYPHVDLSNIGIRFDLKGRAAGMACRRGTQFYMRFNHDMLGREAFDHVLNETVPHEIAHLVCFKDPRLGRNHDAGWARVCRQLGGTGDRCHNEEVVYGKGTTYEYTTTRGHKVRVSDKLHRNVQKGATYTYRHGKGNIDKTCAYSIVGHQGRTLANPIVKKETAPVQPVPPVVQEPVVQPVAVHVPPVVDEVRTPMPIHGESKAATSRRIMLSGYQQGKTYEEIITAMMAACGYNRQLARATFKANAPRVGIPNNWGN